MDNIPIKYLCITLHHLDEIAGKFAAMGVDDEWAAQPVFTVKLKCIMCLWYLTNNNTFRELYDKFNISKCCLIKQLKNVPI